jgi:hypothetical protein
VSTARYGLSHIKQICFVFKGLINNTRHYAAWATVSVVTNSKVAAKLPLSTPRSHTGEVDAQLHSFLSWALMKVRGEFEPPAAYSQELIH